MSTLAKVKFTDYQSSITKALDLIGAGNKLPGSSLIIIKLNLTNAGGLVFAGAQRQICVMSLI